MVSPVRPSHSSDVALWLECEQYGRLELRRVSSASVEPFTPREIPPCEARLHVSIDGQVLSRRVSMPEGASAGKRNIMILSLDHIAPF